MTRLAPLLTVALLGVFTARPVSAQEQPVEAPAHISAVDGAALLERDGRSESAPASMPVLPGDRVRTQAGRVEVLFNDRTTLHLDGNTIVDFQSAGVVRLLAGRVRLNIPGERAASYRVDAPTAWVQIANPGEYRVSILGGDRDAEVELAVIRGAAEIVNEDGRTMVSAGERAFARAGAAPSSAYVFNSAAWDDFDRWSETRRTARLGVSTEYLPESVQSYATTFAEYGSWQYMPTYGNVWYPRVSTGWRPYYYGRWSVLRPYGWTWIGNDPWAWPTHHYGRWGFSAGLWFWIPGVRWSPAWVSWAYAPNYVSWCPLGWNNVAVIPFTGSGFHGGHRFDPWHAWTVVPRHGFGRGFVNVNVVNVNRIDARTRGTFVVRNTGPEISGFAVSRSGNPANRPSVRATDRGSAVPRNGVTAGPAGPGARDVARAVPRGGVTVGSPAAGSNSGASDPTAAFRSRRGAAPALSGPGFPSPAREPRAVSSLPAPRQATPVARDSAAPAGSTDVTQGFQRRAVPRGGDPAAAPSQMTPVAPSFRSVTPDSRRVPVPDRNATPDISGVNRSSGSGAVPRGTNDAYVPPSSGVQRERVYRSPSADAPARTPYAVPRSGPDGPPSYRSYPGAGTQRNGPGPSGPAAPSAAPQGGPSGPPSRSSGQSGGHSRGGGQATGRAVARGGRG